MKHVKGNDRSQIALIPSSLEEVIDPNSEVRVIDLFVDSLDLEELNFRLNYGENGRPAYHPSDLLKLYLYGYMNKVRSSRDLERESKCNLEAMWLMQSLTPDHNTISNFRRDNKEAIAQVFKATVKIARNFNLIGGKLIAGDSTKLRAQNSKKNNFNKKKIERHIKLIDSSLERHNEQLAQADGDDKEKIQEKIDNCNKRKDDYENLDKQIEKSGQPQISTTDPDSRNIMLRNNICEVAYSVQTTVDAENNIPIDYQVTNKNDTKAMGPMLERAQEIIGHNKFTALYDKGYHNGSELKNAEDLGIETIVAIPKNNGASRAPDERYFSDKFIYNQEQDTYTCPEEQTLTTKGKWYQMKSGANVKHYKTKACGTCPVRAMCTRSKTGRLLSRSEFQPQYENNQKLFDQNYQLYRQRQAIVEHPYGTIKRQWGFSYIITKKGMDRASADVGLMFTAYNLRRLFSIIGQKELKKYFKEIASYSSRILIQIKLFLSVLTTSFRNENNCKHNLNIA
jgi:transposase|tara:strand:+ start:197 stop:1726 length:1530 start_codon:yes stop_codon:yes gene_type:complete